MKHLWEVRSYTIIKMSLSLIEREDFLTLELLFVRFIISGEIIMSLARTGQQNPDTLLGA